MNHNLLILGAGGHGRVIREVAEAIGQFDKIDFLDDNRECEVARGVCADLKKFAYDYRYAFAAIGLNPLRMQWLEEMKEQGFTIPVLIHPRAYVSPSASIGPGTIVEAQAIVNTRAVVQDGCIIDAGAIVDHDTCIGKGCHINCGTIVKAHCVVADFTKTESGQILSD